MAFENRQRDGLFQKSPGGVWFVRRGVPAEVRARLGGRFNWIISTKTRDYARARHVRDDLWAKWDAEIAEARSLGSGPVADLPAVLAALDRWRGDKCAAAAGFERGADKFNAVSNAALAKSLEASVGAYMRRPGAPTSPEPPAPPPAHHTPIAFRAEFWAREYFESDPARSRGAAMPHTTGILIGRLQVASREPDGWATLEGFDTAMDAAVDVGGLIAALPMKVRAQARQPFARAWLEVAQHEEAERRRADSILTAMESATAAAAAIRVQAAPIPDTAYEPREGDRTIGEVLKAFQDAQDDPALYKKQYGHIGRALTELVGTNKPIRALTPGDVGDVRRVLNDLPPNVSKGRWKGLPLAVAAEQAAEEGVERIAPNTVRSYMVAFKTICDFALAEERRWLETNPVAGMVPPKGQQKIARKALDLNQLKVAFGALGEARDADSAHYWVPAVLAFSGARANEICQLHVEDIKDFEGFHYIDLNEFDEDGRRLERRQLKSAESARCIPIHEELVAAGFLDLVGRRRDAGEERLFPELKQNVLGYWSHEVSRRWGRLLDSVGLTAPALTLHSLRHGWKDSADAASIPSHILAALGGWGFVFKGSMERYGDRCSPRRVPENSRHMNLVKLDGFKLASVRTGEGEPVLADAA